MSYSNKRFNTYESGIDEALILRNKIAENCRKTGHKFIDKSFSSDHSLYIDKNVVGRKIIWLKPEHIKTVSFDNNLKWTVYDDPKLIDIEQGQVGNCWFIAGLSILVEKKELFDKIFLTKNISNEGFYMLRICFDGIWETVVIDDLFPCYENGQLLYAKSARKQLWVMLIEKAVAKLVGGYQNLNFGTSNYVLYTLTGFPCSIIELDYNNNHLYTFQETLWRNLNQMKNQSYSFTADTRINLNQNMGLVSNHAYSLLDFIELDDTIRLVKLRNTWGRFKWTGDWSENSYKWTPFLAEICGFKIRNRMRKLSDEGQFWMSFEDFLKYYNRIFVCQTNHHFVERRIRSIFLTKNRRKFRGFELTISEKTHLYMSMFNKFEKRVRNNSMILVIYALNRAKLTKIEHEFHSKATYVLSNDFYLNPGKYFIIPMIVNNLCTYDNIEYEYNLVIHSNEFFSIENYFYDASIIRDVLIELVLLKGMKMLQNKNYNYYIFNYKFNEMIIVAENMDPQLYYHFKVQIHDYDSNIICSRGQLTTNDLIAPLHRQIVLFVTRYKNNENSDNYKREHYFYYNINSNLVNYTHLIYNQQTNISRTTLHYPELDQNTSFLHSPRQITIRP